MATQDIKVGDYVRHKISWHCGTVIGLTLGACSEDEFIVEWWDKNVNPNSGTAWDCRANWTKLILPPFGTVIDHIGSWRTELTFVRMESDGVMVVQKEQGIDMFLDVLHFFQSWRVKPPPEPDPAPANLKAFDPLW